MDNGASSYRRFLEGDDNGIVEIIGEYKDGLILFLNRYVDNIHIAEELAEDTFFKLVTRKPRFTSNYSFKTWLYTVGRNGALNHLKHASRFADTPIDELKDLHGEEESLERAYLLEEEKMQLHRALAKLPPNYGAVLYLKYFEELDHDQIARVLKKNKRQVENMLYQAKRALKAELEKEGYGYEK